MKALLFSQIYPSDWEPTRGPYNFNIFRAISSYCDVRVVAPRPWWLRVRRPGELLHVPHIELGGLASAYPTYWSVPSLASMHANAMYWSLKRHIRDLRREFDFDVILAAWMYPDAVTAAKIAEEYDCPFVIKNLGSDINVLPAIPGLLEQIKWSLSRAAKVITVSDALRERVIALGVDPTRAVVQHNGVDGARFVIQDKLQARARLGLDPGQPTICSVGRLSHEKGIDILIDAMSELKKSGRTDVRLYLVGHGEMEQDLKGQAAKLGVEEQVVFCGTRLHDEIPQWISACDVLCLPSRREGCPNVVLEALASGRPVVAARVGGVPEILLEGCGVIVAPENSIALSEGLSQALERHWDPQKLRNSVEFLSWDDIGRSYHVQLVEALQNHGAINSPLIATAGASLS